METPVSRSALYGKLAGPLFRSLESATAFCKLRSNPWVELTHWLHQLTQQPDNDILHVLRHYQIPLSDVEKALLRQLDMLPAGASAISDFSHHIDLSVEKAWMLASVRYGDNKIRSGWLLLALLTTPELRRVLSSICAPLATLPVDELTEILPSLIETSPEAQERPYDGSGLASAIPGESSQAIPNGVQDGKSALAKYCQDMTAQARDGKIDPVTGREHEIRTMTDILLRRRQNNPLLTGEAGVGKTAVVEGFALAIAQGEVPPALREVRLLALDVGALLAGASMKGEFESRLKGLLEEAGRSPQPVILFVDEVHTLVGAGGASGTGDAANLLKPALARGTLRTIGATTWSEYKRHIEKDPALTRRFQVLQIAEPEEIPAMEMVRGLVDTLEKHHNVLILDEAVRAAVQLSHRYIPARQLPGKAISLLDTAAARVALTLHTPPASVQFLRQQLKAAEMERSLLQKQEKMGIQSDERRDALTARIFSLNNELTASESRWQRELELVHTLQELRLAESDADDKTTLQQAETALREWQGDAPVVFPEVSAAVVAAIVADWTGIPAGRMVKDEASQVLELPARLAQRVTGQDGALAQIGERIQTARAGLGDPRKPVPGCGRDRYGYNEWGELTTRRDQQLEWNAQGQLTRVISGNTETHHGYDALGRRTRKATYGRHTGHTARSRTDFVWEGFRLLQENVQQQGWRTYLYDAEQPYTPVASVTGKGESRQVWYYHTDVTGTPQEVTAADGTLVWAGYIRGFGENAADISNSGAYFHQPLRLPGQYFDDETGLHYNLFRYYAPECGRFVSQDPIGLRGGLNLYQYAPNSLTWIDPLGLDVIRLRHYTSNQGFAAIKESMKILAGDQNAVFAVRAKGKPLSMADAADKFKIKQNHARNYIDFDMDTNRVEFRKNDLGVEEYKIKGDIELDEKTTEFNKRC
ncbi:AAA family ATPase [Salmonella enterica subsp. enterica serovar Stanley]|uniref:AAA family ATPase n=11 Tax=Salmonella enterica TaxID=28901 RepID=A0A5Y5VLT9_SALER|nr:MULTISPECIES: RHS repeat-associated core domain-containing protein [Salmonella]EAA0988870.1 protein disaggregation chaperone [Salmonella enterica subsp. enterica serovar Bareilly]EAB7395342.1 AAA family ATPase [Salmonella enterica subsp. enterica serovar Typhimurium]EBF8506593.1 AAA family ATPase [Salmonella enterica subsp. enterica serovar Matopeni]EBG4987816.1 AAA family ATPase [Salmonella enterica subsp. enterica serovar Virchow]EBH3088944.1 AAA family ATPase [Salmonella enterica subsp. 